MEVLVALAVLAIALGTIIQSIGTNASHASYLREKTFAHWVAMNRVAEIQIENKFPPVGSNTGTEEMAGHEWHWKVNVVALNDEMANIRQIQVEVRTNRESKSPVATVLALIGKPNS